MDEKHLHFDVEHSIVPKTSSLPVVLDYPCDKEKFLDGTQWELTIEFSDGHKSFKIACSNAYPYNFDAIQELLGIDSGEDEEDDDEQFWVADNVYPLCRKR